MDDDRLRPPLYDDGKGSDLCVVELNEEDLDDVAPFPIDRQIVQSLLDNATNYLVIQKRTIVFRVIELYPSISQFVFENLNSNSRK